MLKKLILSLFVLLCGAVVLQARTVYITRHAQKQGDKITELGKEQAGLLGTYLAGKKFNGNIYVSPFFRTIQTGAAIAEKSDGRKVILEPALQEIAFGKKHKVMGLKDIQDRLPGKVVPGKYFTDDWRIGGENNDARLVRVSNMFDRLLKEDKGDILLVSHGGTVISMYKAMNRRLAKGVKPVKGIVWNCSLFIFELNDQNQVVSASYTTEYMPDEMLTNNFKAPKIPRPDDPRYAKPKAKKVKK